MDATYEKETIWLAGANRGGSTWTRRFLLQEDDAYRCLGRVDVIDPEPERAIALAQLFRNSGIEAVGHETTVDKALVIPATIRILAIDDPLATFQVVGNGSKQKMLQFGIFASSGFPPGRGSRIIGIGGTIMEGDIGAKEQAKEILRPLVELTGGTRETSRRISSRPVESVQLNPSRLALHSRLAGSIADYLLEKPIQSELLVTDTLTPSSPRIFKAQLVKLNYEPTPKDLLDMSHEIAAGSGDDAVAVVYTRPDRPWIHTDFMVKRAGWWRHQSEFELPIPERIRRIYTEATTPRVTVTD